MLFIFIYFCEFFVLYIANSNLTTILIHLFHRFQQCTIVCFLAYLVPDIKPFLVN